MLILIKINHFIEIWLKIKIKLRIDKIISSIRSEIKLTLDKIKIKIKELTIIRGLFYNQIRKIKK